MIHEAAVTKIEAGPVLIQVVVGGNSDVLE